MLKSFEFMNSIKKLKLLKNIFDMIIKNSSFLRTLNYKELKLLACCEIEYKIFRMKELIEIIGNDDPNLTDAKKSISLEYHGVFFCS